MVKRLTYLLTSTTAILFFQLWHPLVTMKSKGDVWESTLITVVYLLLLKRGLAIKSTRLLYGIAFAAMLTSIFLGVGDRLSFKSIYMFLQAAYPPALILSALYVAILVAFLNKYRKDKELYYSSAAFIGAGLGYLALYVTGVCWVLTYCLMAMLRLLPPMSLPK